MFYASFPSIRVGFALLNDSEPALPLKHFLSSLYHCAVPLHAGTSACAVEHSLGTDWVKPNQSKIKDRGNFSAVYLCPSCQAATQTDVLTICRGQCNSGLKQLGSLTVSRCHFRNPWITSVILAAILGDEVGVTEDFFLFHVSIRRQEILAPLPLFGPTEGKPYKYSRGITDREQEQAGTREKDSFSLAWLLKKLYCCWNGSLTQAVLVLANPLKAPLQKYYY